METSSRPARKPGYHTLSPGESDPAYLARPRPPGPSRTLVEVGLGLACVAALALTGLALATSWGGGYWIYDCVAGAVVSVLALLRRQHRIGTALAGLAVAAGSVVVVEFAALPREPGPAMALALAVLVGSTVRHAPVPWAGAVATTGLAVTIGTWLTGGFTAIAVYNTLGWLVAVAVGGTLRGRDARRRGRAWPGHPYF